MNLKHFYETLESLFRDGKNVACIIASGAETINHGIDDVKKIKEIRDELCLKYNIQVAPHIHMDSVNGWIWLFYKNYDFSSNPLNLDQKILDTARKSYDLIKTIQYADSFSADFHKTGLCPYTGAFFITNNGSDLLNINNDTNIAFNIGNNFGDKKTFRHTIEHSKSCTGIANAYIAIKSLGYEGFQRYIAYLLNTGNYIKHLIETEYSKYFEVINLKSNWHVNVILPRFSSTQPYYQDITKNIIEKELYNQKANSFYNFYSQDNSGDFEKPYLGYVQNHWDSGIKTGIVSFKIYNMSIHMTQENCRKFVENLKLTLLGFTSQKTMKYENDLPHTLK